MSRGSSLQDVFTIRTVPVDLPYLFQHKMVPCNRTALLSCTPNICQARLRQLPYIQFASRFGFTPLILSERAGEETAKGFRVRLEEVGKWVRGLRPKRTQLPLQHLGLPADSSTSPSFPLSSVEVTVGEGPFERLADRLQLCCTNQVLNAKR